MDRIETDTEWWADEVWVLKSDWSPVGAKAYLTFLVDPQHTPPRKPGENVWAMRISKEFPEKQLRHDERQFTLNKKWKEVLSDAMDALHRFRET